jgi:hypothetical protein
MPLSADGIAGVLTVVPRAAYIYHTLRRPAVETPVLSAERARPTGLPWSIRAILAAGVGPAVPDAAGERTEGAKDAKGVKGVKGAKAVKSEKQSVRNEKCKTE